MSANESGHCPIRDTQLPRDHVEQNRARSVRSSFTDNYSVRIGLERALSARELGSMTQIDR